MMHPGDKSRQRRRRLMLAVLRCAGWNRTAAGECVRGLAANSLAAAAEALRADAPDELVRARVNRAMRRLSLAVDLEIAP